jgi:hypothetical protein
MTDSSPQPLDLDAIESRANTATPGPWEAQNYDDDEMDGNWPYTNRVGRPDSAKALAHIVLGSQDAEFVAHAREDIPALVARVRELERDVKDLESDVLSAEKDNLRIRNACDDAAHILRGVS